MVNVEKVTIELTKEEALVLFNYLSEFQEKDSFTLMEQPEQQTLSSLLCQLESILAEPFLPNFDVILNEAKRIITSS